MGKTMRAALMTAHRKMELCEISRPKPMPGELLIRIRHVGVCGSDLHMFQNDDAWVQKMPNGYMILGHEAAGEVVAIGEHVIGFSVGDKVALEPGSTCMQCEFCKSGLYNLCPQVQFLSVPGQRNGVLSEYAAHPANLCFKLPANMSTLQGALVEPLAVGLHAANLGGAKLGMDAVIFGAGCIGLMTLLALKARGVSRVAIVDIVDIRLDKALQLGADVAINSAKENIEETIARLTGGCGADVVFDASGNPAAIGNTLSVTKSAGTIVLVGNPSGAMPATFDLQDFVNREITMKGVFRYRNVYPMAISAISSGILPVEDIPDRIYTLEEAERAFNESIDHKDTIVKAVIEV